MNRAIVACVLLSGCYASGARVEPVQEPVGAGQAAPMPTAGCDTPTNRWHCAGDGFELTVEWTAERDICTRCEADGEPGEATGGYSCQAGHAELRLVGSAEDGYSAAVTFAGDELSPIPCAGGRL